MKDSFVLFTEQIETMNNLTDEEAGKIIKAIYKYEATGEIPNFGGTLDAVFTPFKLALDKTDAKWEEVKQKRRQAGIKGMQSRWQKDITKDNKVITKDNKAITNNNNGITKITVNDNVNVNVNDNNIESKKTKKQFVAPTLDEVREYINTKGLNVNAKVFYDYFTEGGWKDSKGNKVKNWKQKLITWNRYSQKTEDKEYQKEQLDLSGLYDN